jgi:hypothetical protein
MFFIGDCHGRIKQYRALIRALPEGAKSLQLGDMGIGFKGVHLFPGGSLLRGDHSFIRGNHDSPAMCRKHKCYKGEWGYDSSEELFYLGGAWSIDQEWRTENVSWWRDEELSYAELDKAYQLYVQTKPRIVATHEAPCLAAWRMLGSLVEGQNGIVGVSYQAHEPCPTDQSVRLKGDEYAYYKSKLGCVNTRTSQALQRMFEEWQPEYWLFGHYHRDMDFRIGRTQFSCLNELTLKEINLAKICQNSEKA